jgi:hypothetical protein
VQPQPAENPIQVRFNREVQLDPIVLFPSVGPAPDDPVADVPLAPQPPTRVTVGSADAGDGARGATWGYYLTSVPLGVLLVASGQPRDPVESGYEYLCNYTRRAIATAERRVGPLRDHDDIVHQVCVEWLELTDPPNVAFPRLLEGNTVEMEFLRQVVSRVIARAAYQQRRDGSALGEADRPATVDPVGSAWADFRADCERGVGNLSPVEWRVLESRREGLTSRRSGPPCSCPASACAKCTGPRSSACARSTRNGMSERSPGG